MTKLSEIEQETFFKIDFDKLPPEDIFAYNELRSCADLNRMRNDGVLDIKPDFQRNFIWQPADQTRFIDSLTKQLPIPSMCFSLDYNSQRWQVIDGLQRISTIIRFLNEDSWELSRLDDINPKLSGKKVSEIREHNPQLYQMVQNITLPITVVRCDYSKENHLEYMFMIFHRLNAGGVKLNNQEIRNAIFQGPFNDLLKSCNDSKKWKKIIGPSPDNGGRFQNIELILRFFAFFDCIHKYNGKLAPFLNDYMFRNRSLSKSEQTAKTELFDQVNSIILKIKKSKNKKMSKVVLEALWHGIAKNIGHLADRDEKDLNRLYNDLIADTSFAESQLSEGILKREKVFQRLTKATEIFSKSK